MSYNPFHLNILKIIVDVKTRSNKSDIEKLEDNHYLVHIKEAPRKGKANIAIIKLLKKHFKKQVFLVSGHASSRKVFIVSE